MDYISKHPEERIIFEHDEKESNHLSNPEDPTFLYILQCYEKAACEHSFITNIVGILGARGSHLHC